MQGVQLDFTSIAREHGQVYCVDSHCKVSHKQIDLTIETMDDFSKILDKAIKNTNNAKDKAALIYRKRECEALRDTLIEQTGYCKECKQRKDEDIGMDAMEAALNGYNK